MAVWEGQDDGRLSDLGGGGMGPSPADAGPVDNYMNAPHGVVMAAIQTPTNDATRQQNAMARQQGFHNYNEMLLWARQRNQRSGGAVQAQGPSSVVQTVKDGFNNAMAWHPAVILQHIADKLHEINNGNK